MQIYVQRNGEVGGPYSPEQVRDSVASGQILKTDVARLEDSKEWVPILSIPGLMVSPPPLPFESLASPVQPEAAAPKIRYGAVIRDTAIIWVLTAVGGFFVGLAGGIVGARSMALVAASNFLLSIVGFTISGCLATGNRWPHLVHVAVAVWLTSLLNLLWMHGYSIGAWFLGGFFVAIMMAIGGGISFIFKRE